MSLTSSDSPKTYDWLKPTLFTSEIQQSASYPAECLPAIIREAVMAYHQYGQQPLPLIACSALANISLACQSLANVARDRLLISPVSLYFLVIANSGERKSAADHAFGRAIRQWEQKTRESLLPKVRVSRAQHQAWLAQRKSILKQIQRAALSDQYDISSLNERFLEITESEPSIPLLPELYFEDATQEAIVSHLSQGWPSASLWSDEGGIVFSSHGMQNNAAKFVSMLNRLWDGKTFTTHRKTSENFTIENRRLTVSLMLQPIILQQLINKSGGISRQSGFLARSLIAYPSSAMGDRFYQEPPESLSMLVHFHDRLTECLDSSLTLDKSGCGEIPLLQFSPQAKANWVSFFNFIESGLQKSSQWQMIKDFASKAAENVARLSALFHLFEGKEGDVSCESLEQAIQIIHWHLLEARRILNSQPQSSEQEDAIKLFQWISGKELKEVTARYLQQYGPIRDKTKRDNAILALIENGYLKEVKLEGKAALLVNNPIK